MFRNVSAISLLALLCTGSALAQSDIRTKPLSSGTRSPAEVIRGADADSITRAVQGQLDIVDFSPARTLSTQRVKLQGVGNAVRYNISYEITVHNPSALAKTFRIITDVAGEPRSRSAQFEVLPGRRVRTTQNATFALPAAEVTATLGLLNPNSRPVRVRVIDAAGLDLDAVNLALE